MAGKLKPSADPRVPDLSNWPDELRARLPVTDRQMQIVLLRLEGLEFKEAAAVLGLSYRTCEVQMNDIKQRLHARTPSRALSHCLGVILEFWAEQVLAAAWLSGAGRHGRGSQ